MSYQNVFMKSVVIGATVIGIAASLTTVAQAQGGRDPVELTTKQEFAEKRKSGKTSFFGKLNKSKEAKRGGTLFGKKTSKNPR